MESALARALPASLHTFLFRIRGWLHEQAAGIGEELDKMQFRTWKPCLPFREQDEEAKSQCADRATCPSHPACCHLPLRTSRESASPCLGVIPWTEHRHSSCPRPPGNRTQEPLSTLAVRSCPSALPV